MRAVRDELGFAVRGFMASLHSHLINDYLICLINWLKVSVKGLCRMILLEMSVNGILYMILFKDSLAGFFTQLVANQIIIHQVTFSTGLESRYSDLIDLPL